RNHNDATLRKLVVGEVNKALKSDNVVARAAAVECAERIAAPDFHEALIERLSADDPAFREKVVRALSTNQHPDVFTPLLTGLRDANADVRAAAANGLRYRASNQENEDLVEPLKSALGDTDRRVRINAAQALGSLQSP